jgi:2-methylisocitrate lyase-like PEP mutase family enzyme
MAREHIQVLRKMLQSDRGVILPGAPNALAARVVADLGFSAVYLTGAGSPIHCSVSPISAFWIYLK